MFKNFSHKKNVLLTYAVISVLFLLISLVALLFNEWAVIVCVGICSIFGLFNTLLMLGGEDTVSVEATKASFVVYLLLRYIIMAIGLVISGLVIKFSMGEEVNKIRYAYLLAAALPYFGTSISILISSRGN